MSFCGCGSSRGGAAGELWGTKGPACDLVVSVRDNLQRSEKIAVELKATHSSTGVNVVKQFQAATQALEVSRGIFMTASILKRTSVVTSRVQASFFLGEETSVNTLTG